MPSVAKSGTTGWGSQGNLSSSNMVMPNKEYDFGSIPSRSMKKRFGDSRFGKRLSSLRSGLRKKTAPDLRQSLLGGGRRRRKKSGKKKRTKRRTKRRTKKARHTRRTRRR